MIRNISLPGHGDKAARSNPMRICKVCQAPYYSRAFSTTCPEHRNFVNTESYRKLFRKPRYKYKYENMQPEV